jgi:hypothetical protein
MPTLKKPDRTALYAAIVQAVGAVVAAIINKLPWP